MLLARILTWTVAFGDQAIATNILSRMLRLLPETTRKVTISRKTIDMVSKPKALPKNKRHSKATIPQTNWFTAPKPMRPTRTGRISVHSRFLHQQIRYAWTLRTLSPEAYVISFCFHSYENEKPKNTYSVLGDFGDREGKTLFGSLYKTSKVTFFI